MPQQHLLYLSNLSLSHSPFQAEFNNTVVPKVGNIQNKGQKNFRGSFSPKYLSNQPIKHIFLVHNHSPLLPSPAAVVLANGHFKADAACMKFSLREEIEKHTVEGNVRIV